MATRYSRRLYSYRRAGGYARNRYPKRRASGGYRGGTRYVRGYGSYWSAAAPYAIRALPYIRRAYSAYRKGGTGGLKSYAGKLASSAARSAIKTVTGYGKYSSLGRRGMTGLQAPKIINGASMDGSVVISHREYLGDIRTSSLAGKFAINAYRINPGEDGTFPWLSQIAQNFQEYRLEGMGFNFRSMSGDAITSANTALGSVMMATQYDPQQATPTTKQEMENIEFAQSTKPSASMMHYIECSKSQSPLSTLYISPQPKGDSRFYDFGNFYIATQGMQGTFVNIGELWVTYQIRLFKPLLWDALGKDVQIYTFAADNSDNINMNSDKPFGVDGKFLQSSIITKNVAPESQIQLVSQSATSLQWANPGLQKCYMLNMMWDWTTHIGQWVPPVVTGVNCAFSYEYLNWAGGPGGTVENHAPNSLSTGTTLTRGWVQVYILVPPEAVQNGLPFGVSLTGQKFGTTGTGTGFCDAIYIQLVEMPYPINGQ